MNEKITKPITIIRQEFIEQLMYDINSCPLPPFVIESILKDILDAVRMAAQKQYEEEKAQYEKQLFEKNKVNLNVSE